MPTPRVSRAQTSTHVQQGSTNPAGGSDWDRICEQLDSAIKDELKRKYFDQGVT